MLQESTIPDNPKFKEMKNIIHSDEKWFNGTKKNMTVYMHPDEEDPLRTVPNKNSIHKVMFYSAIGRPRFDAEGRCYFDGKLGIWAFCANGTNLYLKILANPFMSFELTFFSITGTGKKGKSQQTKGHTYHKDHEG